MNHESKRDVEYEEAAAMQKIIFLLMGVIEKHDLCIPNEVVRLSLVHDIELPGDEEDIEVVYEDEEDE